VNRRALLKPAFIVDSAPDQVVASGPISELVGQGSDLKPLTYGEFLPPSETNGGSEVELM
jgi:hypothetical protein